MDPNLQRIFQQQIQLQCQAVERSGRMLTSLLSEEQTEQSMAYIWITIQDFLNAAANISKALWGAGGKRADQREPLRASLHVKDDSPLRRVTMRNNFEHYDERLDEWWKTSKNGNHIDRAIYPRGTIAGAADRDTFRVLDPETGEVIFWGEPFSLPEIAYEAASLHLEVNKQLTEPFRPSG